MLACPHKHHLELEGCLLWGEGLYERATSLLTFGMASTFPLGRHGRLNHLSFVTAPPGSCAVSFHAFSLKRLLF